MLNDYLWCCYPRWLTHMAGLHSGRNPTHGENVVIELASQSLLEVPRTVTILKEAVLQNA